MSDEEGEVHPTSYSRISTMLQCPKRHELEKIIKVPVKPAVFFAGGAAVHRTTEILDKGNMATEQNAGAGSMGEAEMPVLQFNGEHGEAPEAGKPT